jgi:CHAT domain-containing protein
MNRFPRWREARVCLLACMLAPTLAHAQTAKFIPPPRTIGDITAILDRQKPDPVRIAKLRDDADAEPATDANPDALRKFYFGRAIARRLLGRVGDAIPDNEKAIEIGSKLGVDLFNMQNYLVQLLSLHSDPERVLQLLAVLEREYERRKGFLFNIYKWQVYQYLSLGNFAQAEARLKKSETLLRESRSWPHGPEHQSDWGWQTEEPRAAILQARGRYREADEAYRRMEALLRQELTLAYSRPNPPVRGNLERALDNMITRWARVKASQGKLAEAEADVRRVLLSRLKLDGRYNRETPGYIMDLAIILGEQARNGEAEQLARAALETYRTLGVAEDSAAVAGALNFLGTTQQRRGRWNEAAATFAELDKSIASWDTKRSEGLRISANRMFTFYNTNQVERGIEIARLLVARNMQRLGQTHFDTARARGQLAIGLSQAGRNQEAIEEFRPALSILMSVSRLSDDGSGDGTQYDASMRSIVESYIGLLARAPQVAGGDAATESFRLADVIRSRPVQNALAASSARAAAGNPALAALARKEQDLQKEASAQFGLLNNTLALPPEQRDDKAIGDLRDSIDRLHAEHAAARAEIARKFPNYDSLIEPRSPSVEQIRAVLKPDEAVLSFYFGGRSSFVWAVPKEGPVAFAEIKASVGNIGAKIKKLRAALEPNLATIADIPPFDFVLAHELYALLLAPVEAGWKSAKNLIVVTNGALGGLPLGLLVTAPASIDAAAQPLFVGYRGVPWLARTHAVTMVPSASTLVTLRRLPAASARREKLIGFGDPVFSKEQMQDAARRGPDEPMLVSEAVTRGIPLKLRSSAQFEDVNSAELALLPRLPDTAEELKSIALALNADPSKVLNLGIKANEQTVKSTDLSKYKIIVFATHGLVPGDLDGLTQPALALSAPDVAGGGGDGLLTMEEILGLKLDADWVVLSACNTGAGAGAAAEAASGLGRAFFYAGTRAVLVTNWSVESVSARELVTDLFRRQAADAKVTRSAALKEAMNALIDGPGATDASGRTVYTYAHPLFWAPYTIIGDGG